MTARRQVGWVLLLAGLLPLGCARWYSLNEAIVYRAPEDIHGSVTESRIKLYRARVYNPGNQPDATTCCQRGTDGELNGVEGTRTVTGGESWSGGPSAQPYRK